MLKNPTSALIQHKGFTLIELMIVVAIIAILATIAMPSYQNYTKKAAVTELIQAGSPFKSGVELCLLQKDGASNCNAGTNGIPKKLENKGNILSIVVNNGIITVTGREMLANISYTLTPPTTDQEEWKVTCSDKEYFPASFCSE